MAANCTCRAAGGLCSAGPVHGDVGSRRRTHRNKGYIRPSLELHVLRWGFELMSGMVDDRQRAQKILIAAPDAS